jgi:hypothetical protein
MRCKEMGDLESLMVDNAPGAITDRHILIRKKISILRCQVLISFLSVIFTRAAIIVCTEPEKAYDQNKDLAVIDASLAGENILLAIEALARAWRRVDCRIPL